MLRQLARIATVVADDQMDEDNALENLLQELDDGKRDGRKRRRGGWGGLEPAGHDAKTVPYLQRFRGDKLEQSMIWKAHTDPASADPTCREGREWVNDHMLPWPEFLQLVHDAKSIPALSRKEEGERRVKGPHGIPMKHLVACALYKLHQDVPYKTVAKLGGISEPVIRRFVPALAKHMVLAFYQRDVYPPTTEADVNLILAKHGRLGFPGCITMWDGVPVEWLNCPSGDLWCNQGKEGYPTRSFLISGDMNGTIHECSQGFTGTTNDLTKSRFSPMMDELRTGIYADMSFDVTCLDGSTRSVKGLWSICDNGLHKWTSCQQPEKRGRDQWVQRWSKRMESARKPGSENIFGRLKKRFPGLLRGLRVYKTEDITWLVKFACMLHNRCQRYYELSTIGEYENDWIRLCSMAVDLARISASSDVGQGRIPVPIDARAAALNDQTPQVENGFYSLRAILVEHYRVLWERREICWPRTAMQCRGLRHDPRPLLARGQGYIRRGQTERQGVGAEDSEQNNDEDPEEEPFRDADEEEDAEDAEDEEDEEDW